MVHFKILVKSLEVTSLDKKADMDPRFAHRIRNASQNLARLVHVFLFLGKKKEQQQQKQMPFFEANPLIIIVYAWSHVQEYNFH